jgi:4-hydroxybenzoate polyprenyltransferase
VNAGSTECRSGTRRTEGPTKRGWRHEVSFLLKVARPGFWLTQLWFFLLPLAQTPVLASPRFWLGVVYITFGLGFILYGWNDLVDAETDRLNPRKDSFLFGARGTSAQLRRLPWQIALVQLPFVVAFIWMDGLRMLGWFAALVGATALYNHFPPSGLKGRPPFEVLNQAGYLLVFVLSSWLNQVPLLPRPTFVFGALFAMHSHLFGEIMDVAPDRAAGRRTTATIIGVRATKFLIAAFLLCESALVWAYFENGYVTGGLLVAALVFVTDAAVLWRERPYSPAYMRAAFVAWNLAAAGTMLWLWHTAALSVVR